MKPPIFNRNDFRLCSVPVPRGYPQSQTHAGISINNGRYYLTTSPFPGPRFSIWKSRLRRLLNLLSFGRFYPLIIGEKYENPFLYIGVDKDGAIPTQFELMQRSALMGTPESFYDLPSYNSDPDIFIEDGIINILNRCVVRTHIYEDNRPYDYITRLYLIKGVDENAHFKLLSIQLVRDGIDNIVSPSLIHIKDQYVFTYLDNRISGREVIFDNLYISVEKNIMQAVQACNRRAVAVVSEDFIPWHMSIFNYNDDLFSIVTCTKRNDTSLRMWQMLGRFNNQLTELVIFPIPLTDYNSYRGSALVRDDGTFVLYTSVVHEVIRGSDSIDGRDILVTSLSFEDLLKRICDE